MPGSPTPSSALKLTSCTDPDQAASFCADTIASTLATRPESVLILPAGNTPLPLFGELLRRQESGSVNLKLAHLVQLDELVGVPKDDSRSFQSFLKRTLMDPLGRDGSRDYLIDGTAPDPAAEIARHAQALRKLGPIDLAVLGIGLNGHVAFNEPGTTEEDSARFLPLAATTRLGLHSAFAEGQVPTHGVTLGLAELRSARAIRILATGSKKAAIVARLLKTPRSKELPASLLAPHPDLELLADQEALSPDASGGDSTR